MAGLDWDYEVVWDGGCSPNPGLGYGSYRIETKAGRKRIETCRFGFSTSNVAEYRTLEAALGDLLLTIQRAGRSPKEFAVRCVGDSQLVINQVIGDWAVRKQEFAEYRNRCRKMLKQFGDYELVWQPRAKTVEVLGH